MDSERRVEELEGEVKRLSRLLRVTRADTASARGKLFAARSQLT